MGNVTPKTFEYPAPRHLDYFRDGRLRLAGLPPDVQQLISNRYLGWLAVPELRGSQLLTKPKLVAKRSIKAASDARIKDFCVLNDGSVLLSARNLEYCYLTRVHPTDSSTPQWQGWKQRQCPKIRYHSPSDTLYVIHTRKIYSDVYFNFQAISHISSLKTSLAIAHALSSAPLQQGLLSHLGSFTRIKAPFEFKSFRSHQRRISYYSGGYLISLVGDPTQLNYLKWYRYTE